MLILLSPSKTQDFSSYYLPKGVQTSTPLFSDYTFQLISVLSKFSPIEIQKLMSVSENIANLNWSRFQDFSPQFIESNSKPSFLAFQGDVYKFIDSSNYSLQDWQFANQHCLTISGLYGLLKPLDLIQPYRLEMKTKLKTTHSSDLYQFWGSKLSTYIDNLQVPFVLNLASNEYSKAILNSSFQTKLVNVIFKDKKDSKYKIIAIYAKLARGAMANHIIQNRITSLEDIKKIQIDGYKFSSDDSTSSTFVYLRG